MAKTATKTEAKSEPKAQAKSQVKIPKEGKPNANPHKQVGIASWFGKENTRGPKGNKLDGNRLIAAHRTLPLGTKVKITRVRTGKSVVVAIEDRGPYAKKRIVDLSRGAAAQLGIIHDGTALVHLEVLHLGVR